jgi:hypothetical protein
MGNSYYESSTQTPILPVNMQGKANFSISGFSKAGIVLKGLCPRAVSLRNNHPLLALCSGLFKANSPPRTFFPPSPAGALDLRGPLKARSPPPPPPPPPLLSLDQVICPGLPFLLLAVVTYWYRPIPTTPRAALPPAVPQKEVVPEALEKIPLADAAKASVVEREEPA